MRYIVALLLLLFATVAYAQRGHFPENNSNPVTKHNVMDFQPPIQVETDGMSNNVSILNNSIDEDQLGPVLTFAADVLLDFTAWANTDGDGLILPTESACANVATEGQICWEDDIDALWIGDGSAPPTQIAGGGVQVNPLTFGDGTDDLVHNFDTDSTDPSWTYANDGEATYSHAMIVTGVLTTTNAALTTPDLGIPSAIDITAATGSLDLGTGTISGAVVTEYDTAANIGSPAITEFGGKWFFITSGTETITLPEITASGQSACFYSVTAINVTLEVDDTDIFVLPDLADLDAGDTIDSDDSKGAFVCMISQENGGADKWFILGMAGVWSDGGAT